MNDTNQKRMPICDRRLTAMTYTPRSYKIRIDAGSRVKATRIKNVRIKAANKKRVFGS